ncbi:Hypothetical proteinHypothetical protein domain [Nesidiocoris tenuis]|uniref:Uncharacterized protein n=1 Tax=Nesidiocoris tenuis TaxID=355587 RepID=A0ABN7ARK2_9HEMI|nr:Hypothetical proteinHypothetical protein domain [Nesidiocoris tenuis]
MSHQQWWYIDFVVTSAGNNPHFDQLDAVTTKSLLLSSLKTFFGDSAAGLGFDLLGFRPAQMRGIIRCSASLVVKLRASMTLPVELNGETLSFSTIKASPLLTALLADSRSYKHKNYLTAKRKLQLESYSDDGEAMDTDGS